MISNRFGATKDEWIQLDVLLGLTADLLPVVSNPDAPISPASKMKTLGKTPSRYDRQRQVVGIPEWTSYQASGADMVRWAAEPDYGICLQTRYVRAFDIDVEDPEKSEAIRAWLEKEAGVPLPRRMRSNSGKQLLAFIAGGDFRKRKVTVDGGVVEFLATGNQFIAAGQHTSGVRYEWAGGLPDNFPQVPHIEMLWTRFAKTFGVGPSKSDRETSTRMRGEHLMKEDDTLAKLDVLEYGRGGEAYITCPFKAEHTTDSGVTETVYFPAGTNGYERGHFKCLHAHCADRDDGDFIHALGIVADEFEVILPEESTIPGKSRFEVIGAPDFMNAPDAAWMVDGILPENAMAMVVGASGSGKSFFILDLLGHIALGRPWNGRDVEQGKVIYIAAEGSTGFRKRMRAFREKFGELPGNVFGVIDDCPNLLKNDPELTSAIARAGGANVIVIDTLAQTTPGANENAGEDMSKALANCKLLNQATGATIILVHHLGKDPGRGARGWSGIYAAMDMVIEISMKSDIYCARVTKQKDGEDGLEFPFRLQSVPLGKDSKGKEVTSCIVTPIEGGTESKNLMPRRQARSCVCLLYLSI